MNSTTDSVDRLFQTIGARAVVEPARGDPSLDVREDRHGGRFVIRLPEEAAVEVLNRDTAGRHLVLMVRDGAGKSRFLCGHDERHWFVAAIPDAATNVVTVAQAKAALQPPEVRRLAEKLRPKRRFQRHTPRFKRQGEWFFVPVGDFTPPEALILRNEPLSRGRGKFHQMQYAYRTRGEVLYVSSQYPRGLKPAKFEALSESVRRRQNWRQMIGDADVFAAGRITHPDHDTLVLRGWHRVLMNTERGARAMRQVAFLD